MKLKIPIWVGTIIGLLSMGMMPAFGAEKIKLYYSILEFSLPVNDLKTYAQKGKINSQLASYTKRLKPENVAQLRQVLTEKQKLSPLAISQFLYSELGESMLKSAGRLIQTDSGQNGFYAIRAALILAIFVQAFSTAFMKVYLAHQTQYRPFLSVSYVKNANRDEQRKVYFIRSLPSGFPLKSQK